MRQSIENAMHLTDSGWRKQQLRDEGPASREPDAGRVFNDKEGGEKS